MQRGNPNRIRQSSFDKNEFKIRMSQIVCGSFYVSKDKTVCSQTKKGTQDEMRGSGYDR